MYGGIIGEDPEETYADDWELPEAPWDVYMREQKDKEQDQRNNPDAQRKRWEELQKVREAMKAKKDAILKRKREEAEAKANENANP